MAPALIRNAYLDRDGRALEETSDAIDELNVLKAQLKAEKSIYEASEFDAWKDKTKFRQFEESSDRVKAFYKEQHEKQTVAYNLQARNDFKSKVRAEMTIWEAMEKLNTLIDESDPDTSLSQIEHLLQSAEAIRRDGKPRWFQLTGLIHDLGKLLFFFGAQGQWDVVGDTFPVGCAFDKKIILQETFKSNPDFNDSIYSTPNGIYSPGCGMDNVMLSWGHDEYLYQCVKAFLSHIVLLSHLSLLCRARSLMETRRGMSHFNTTSGVSLLVLFQSCFKVHMVNVVLHSSIRLGH